MASSTPSESIVTLPVDLLKHITDNLDPRDGKALKLTCKRLNLLIAPRPSAHSHFLAIHPEAFIVPPPRDGRATPLPQSPMPWKQAKSLQETERENLEVEDRDRDHGMELSDTEDGYEDTEDGRSDVGGGGRQTTYKPKKNILNWTSQLDSAPATPRAGSPTVTTFAESMPSFKITSS